MIRVILGFIATFAFSHSALAQCYSGTVGEELLCKFSVPAQSDTCVTNPYLDSCDDSNQCGTTYYKKFHPGTDCRAKNEKEVMSPVSGKVVKTYIPSQKKWVGPHEDKWGTVVIDTGGENYLLVLHMSESYVRLGDNVQVGCVLGKSGWKGLSSPNYAHVHYERKKYLPHPSPYLHSRSDASKEMLENPGSNWGPANKPPKAVSGFRCRNW